MLGAVVAVLILYYLFMEKQSEVNNNMLGFNGREARLAGRVREMEEQNQLLRRQLTISQNQLVSAAAVKTNNSVNIISNGLPPCHKHHEAEVPKCEVIQIAIVCAGYNSSRSVVTLIKSILFYRKNPLHFHLISDSVAQVILQTLFNTWSVPQVKPSGIYSRGQAMLAALASRDREILLRLQIPQYESTQGLTAKEKEVAMNSMETLIKITSSKINDGVIHEKDHAASRGYKSLSEKHLHNLNSQEEGSTNRLHYLSDPPLVPTEEISNDMLEEHTDMSCNEDFQQEAETINEDCPSEQQTDHPNETSEHDLNESNSTTKSEKKRRWDRKNFCMYCENLCTNFRRHILRKHKTEAPLAHYMAMMEVCSEESKVIRRKIFDDLRNKGNNIYNRRVLNDSSDDKESCRLLPARRVPVNAKCVASNYVTCMFCQGLYSKKSFRKHVPKCAENFKRNEEVSSTNEEDDDEDWRTMNARNRKCPNFVKRYGVTYHPTAEVTTAKFKEQILPTLKKNDEVVMALQDPLVMGITCDFLSNHLKNNNKQVVSRKIHDAGKLLMNIRKKDETILLLRDCLHPNKINLVFDVVKEMCGIDEITGNVEVVGMPARLSWILNEGAARAIDDLLCDESLTDEQRQLQKRDINDFLEIKKRRWKYMISTNAEISRIKKKMMKSVVLPQDEDVKKLASFLKEKEIEFFQSLSSNKTLTNYENLCEVTIAHIITLSRRRPAEAATCELRHYEARGNNNYISESVLETLTEEEKSAFKNLKMFVVPGKNEQQVPILMTNQIEKNINLIVNCRSTLGIEITNPYLFARPGLKTSFDGGKVLSKLKKQCPGLAEPQHLTATGLRHHCATVSQVHGEKYVTHLSKFMGHSSHIHKKNYEYPLDVIQKGVLGRRMLSMEGSTSERTEEPGIGLQMISEDNYDILNNDNKKDSQHIVKMKKRWSNEEKCIVIEEFKEFISSRKNAGLHRCKALIEKHDILKSRSSAQINIMIDNINKGKIKLPTQFQYLKQL